MQSFLFTVCPPIDLLKNTVLNGLINKTIYIDEEVVVTPSEHELWSMYEQFGRHLNETYDTVFEYVLPQTGEFEFINSIQISQGFVKSRDEPFTVEVGFTWDPDFVKETTEVKL